MQIFLRLDYFFFNIEMWASSWYNISIVDSEIGKVINFVGSGTAYFENVILSGGSRNYFLALRSDYGSTWNGDIIIRNSKLVSSKSSANLIQLSWNSWNFGYTCYIPNIDVDGFTVVNKSGTSLASTSIYLFNNFAKKNPLNDLVNPYIAPTFIKTKNFYFKDYVSSSVLVPVFDGVRKEKLWSFFKGKIIRWHNFRRLKNASQSTLF